MMNVQRSVWESTATVRCAAQSDGLGPGRDAVAEVGDLDRAVARDGELGVLRRDGHHDRRLARQREGDVQHVARRRAQVLRRVEQ